MPFSKNTKNSTNSIHLKFSNLTTTLTIPYIFSILAKTVILLMSQLKVCKKCIYCYIQLFLSKNIKDTSRNAHKQFSDLEIFLTIFYIFFNFSNQNYLVNVLIKNLLSLFGAIFNCFFNRNTKDRTKNEL